MLPHAINNNNNTVHERDQADSVAVPSRSPQTAQLYQNYLDSLNNNPQGTGNVAANNMNEMNINVQPNNVANHNLMQEQAVNMQQVVGIGSFLFNPFTSMFGHKTTAMNCSQNPAQNVNESALNMLEHQHQQQYLAATTPQLQVQSPVPVEFFTPKQGPTPAQSPQPFSLDVFHDAMSRPPSAHELPPSTAQAPPVAGRGVSQPTTVPVDMEDTTNESSLLRKGISVMGGTISAVATSVTTYISSSRVSGIPFHIADKAMKDSKENYTRWWQDGINTNESDAAKTDKDGRVTKRRKVENGQHKVGSDLSIQLKKNLSDMGFNTENHPIGKVQNTPNQWFFSRPAKVDVDSSIINSRRRSNSGEASSSGHPDKCSGYNMFNNVSTIYGSDMFQAGVKESVTRHQDFSGDDALYSHYYTTGGEDDANEASTSAGNTSTITSNYVGSAMQVIEEMLEEKNRISEENELFQCITSPRDWIKKTVRSEMIDSIRRVQGDVKDKAFLSSLEILKGFYNNSGRDARVSPWAGRQDHSSGYIGEPLSEDLLEGVFLNLSRPSYVECLGRNDTNEFLYTLGRMSFDIFAPRELICSVQSTHSVIQIMGEKEELPEFIPTSLKEEVTSLCDSCDGSSNRPLLRSYDILVSMTIEPPSSVGKPESKGTPTPTKRLRALLSVKGYILPDPEVPNRLTVWFAGGKLAPARLSNEDPDAPEDEGKNDRPVDDSDEYGGLEEWQAIFSKHKWRKTLGERARAMAANLLLGAEIPNKVEDDGSMEYRLRRPIGGHGKIYIDVLYLDDDILIMRGHRGTIYAMARNRV